MSRPCNTKKIVNTVRKIAHKDVVGSFTVKILRNICLSAGTIRKRVQIVRLHHIQTEKMRMKANMIVSKLW